MPSEDDEVVFVARFRRSESDDRNRPPEIFGRVECINFAQYRFVHDTSEVAAFMEWIMKEVGWKDDASNRT